MIFDGGDLRAIKLPPDRSSVPAARHFAAESLGALGASDDVTEEVRLLVSELATNAVVHAGTPLRVSVLACCGRLRIEVRDDEPIPPDPPAAPDALSTHGRGMLILDTVATEWGVNGNERGKTVWFELDPAIRRPRRGPGGAGTR